MRLADWLKKTGITQRALAEAIGTTQGYISQLARGESEASDEIKAKIRAATNGDVAGDDWLPVVDTQPMAVPSDAKEAAE